MIGERLAAPERLRRLLALLLLAVPACMVARLWLDPAVAWMHPEAANIAAWGTVAGSPPEGITLDRLSTIPLELEAEGPRPRILSVSTEAGEAILRPAWTAVLGPHPSIAPLGLLTAVFAPFLFFRWLRLRHVGSVRAAALTAVLLTSTFMLSVLIPYIRPAKKYTILWACLAFYLAERHRAKRTLGLFWLLVIVLGLAFFSDEEGYFLAPMVALIYAPSLLRGTPFWQRALVLGLPVLCFAGAQYGLALVVAGHDGGAAWDVLALPQHFGYNPAAFVLNPDFWPSAAGQVARNLLTVVGIYRHTRLTEAISLVVALAAVAASVLALRRHAGAGHLQYQLTAATAVLAISGLYLTALDWWPREQNSPNFYVSSFGYYYRSSAVVLLVVWLALLWDAALQALGQASEQLRTVVAVGGVVACVAITWSNLAAFPDLNLLVRLIHSTPASMTHFNTDIAAHAVELRDAPAGTPVTLTRVLEPENSDATFSATYARLFGDDPEWPTAQFRTTYQGHPFDGLYGYMQALVKAYYPLRDVVVEDVNYSGVARDRQRLQDLRALQVALWRYHDLHGRFPCAAENVWQWSSSGASWISDDPAACGYTDVEPLSTAIGAPLPADPLGSQHAGVPFWAPTDSYTYGYLSCPNSYGQFFVLGMRLEVLYLDVPQHQIVDCSGNTVQWPPEVVGLTALDPLDGESQPRPLPPVASPAALARDAQRKADLQQVRDQLLAYRERYGRFPCPGVGQWQFSSAGPQWIADLSPDCGASPPGSLGALPVDPVNQPGAFWAGALGYGYRAYGAECPEWMRGQYFVLGARLENSSDPDLAERPRDCTNVVIPWPADVYALTSDDQSAAVTPGLVPDQHDGALVRPPAAADARR